MWFYESSRQLSSFMAMPSIRHRGGETNYWAKTWASPSLGSVSSWTKVHAMFTTRAKAFEFRAHKIFLMLSLLFGWAWQNKPISSILWASSGAITNAEEVGTYQILCRHGDQHRSCWKLQPKGKRHPPLKIVLMSGAKKLKSAMGKCSSISWRGLTFLISKDVRFKCKDKFWIKKRNQLHNHNQQIQQSLNP